MRNQGARFKATQGANIRCNASCLKKNLFFSFSDPGQSWATVCILRLFDSFFFYDTFSMTALFSLQNGAHLQASTSLSTRSFCESILYVHLKVLRGSELCLMRTVGMVRLDEILFETLSKKWHLH